jgi:uncharacterized RDD family membrane protein YckC
VHRRELSRRSRQMVTPEGLALPLTIASRGARAGALILDLVILFTTLVLVALALIALGIGLFETMLENVSAPPAAIELVAVAFILVTFLARFFYFMWFELGPRGATPGKRLVGIRVAARPAAEGSAGRLTAEAVIARNLLRDVEVFMPLSFLLGGGWSSGVVGIAATVWLAIFLLFPFFNRDALRAGDLVAGTWVVEAERTRLSRALSLGTPPPAAYRFGPAELSVYGEHELQVLEQVLRTGDQAAMREVAEAICRKIGWEPGAEDSQVFLKAFYAALRAHLERDLRFGRRKKDKFG